MVYIIFVRLPCYTPYPVNTHTSSSYILLIHPANTLYQHICELTLYEFDSGAQSKDVNIPCQHTLLTHSFSTNSKNHSINSPSMNLILYHTYTPGGSGAQSEDVKRAEEFLKRRLGLRMTVNTKKIIEEAHAQVHNIPSQHTLSTDSVNTPCQHTLSTHHLNTFYLLTCPIIEEAHAQVNKIPFQHTLSTHPVNTSSQHILSTHPTY